MYRFILLGILIAFSPLHSALSKSDQKEHQITKLKVSTETSKEKITILFTEPFNESVSFLFDPGFLKVVFPHTQFKSKLAKHRINNQFIRNIRLIKEGSSTIVEVQFANSQFEPIGRINYIRNKKQLILTIDRQKNVLDANQSDVLGMESETQLHTQNIWDNAPTESTPFSDDFGTNSIIKMLLVLFLLLLCFYVILWLYKRFFMSRFRYNAGRYDIKIISSFHIGPKQRILIMEIDGSVLAVGVTQNNINVISKITDDSFSDFLSARQTDAQGNIDFAELRQEYRDYKNFVTDKEVKEEKIPSKLGFADELLNRIKKMKPID